MKKYFPRILHYSTALPESSPIMKIINFHEKPWFSLIFIDFHWFGSKIMKIDGFRCSWTSPASGIRSETVCASFFNRWEKIFFHEKIFFCTLHYSTAMLRAAPGHQNHQFSWKIMVFIDFHWFWSKIMKIDGFRCSWTSPHPVLGQKQFA